MVVDVPAQELLAKVNHAPVSKTDVELSTLELKRFVQASGQEWKPLPAQDVPDALDLTDILNNLVDAELKAQEVRARGLDLKPEFKRRLAYIQRGFYAQEWDRWQREREVPVDQDIHQFYEQNKAGFQDPERIRVRMIVTSTLSEAESIRATAVQGSDFAQLAREHSVGPGKDQGGEAGWYVREVHRRLLASTGQLKDEKTFFEQLEPVVFALQDVGQVSMPVKGSDNRYYVV
ncbi:MAG: peptidyl-prolyl cis-trans isomerase, partial [Candidatus Omnitrophica bacterium]|nr:peptidyl-prolyl cis-trans isomerase [Candidatus Omnitrophota bacterium]